MHIEDGFKVWRRPCNENIHREDGPALIWPNGSEQWYFNGACHRIGAPAYHDPKTGAEMWYVDGKLHRLDGPAQIWPYHVEIEWHIKGEQYTFEEWCSVLHKTDEEITMIKLQYGGIDGI